MLRAFHALTHPARVALSISIFLGVLAGGSLLSGCSDSEQQASRPPEGPSDQVLRDADEHMWAQAVHAGTLGAFTDYVQNFTNGKHAAEARGRIAALEAQASKDADERAWATARQADTAAAYADFLRDFPASAHGAEARERQAALDPQQARRELDEKSWAEALRLGTQVSLREYLRQFPNGAHAAEARQRIAALNAEPAAEAKAGMASDKKDVASKAKPKRSFNQSATTDARAQPKAAPSTSSKPSFRSFWQSLFPQPSK
jgi:hypothetical protein